MQLLKHEICTMRKDAELLYIVSQEKQAKQVRKTKTADKRKGLKITAASFRPMNCCSRSMVFPLLEKLLPRATAAKEVSEESTIEAHLRGSILLRQ